MPWVVMLVFAWVVGLIVVVARVRRNQGIVREMSDLMVSGRHQEVLDHALPAKPFREQARVMQVTSAVLTGRFVLALDLLADSTDDGTFVPAGTPGSTSSRLRAVSLLGMGRYGEVARLLGDHPFPGPLRRLRAQAAVEVGDDDLADTLLADAYTDPLEEAGRLRLLGDLRLRRGHLQEGERLVRTARASYAGSAFEGAQVDVAVCTLHLVQARLSAGLVGEALPLVLAGLEGLQVRPDNAPAFAEAHGLAARVHAALGDGAEAGSQLATAQEHACRSQSPALDAEVIRSAALVALALDDHEVGRRLLLEAIAAHEQLGAAPVVAELRAALAGMAG